MVKIIEPEPEKRPGATRPFVRSVELTETGAEPPAGTFTVTPFSPG